jgi:hypothetical protein
MPTAPLKAIAFFATVASTALLAAGGLAAPDTKATPTAQQLAFFEAKVRPVLANNCFACHSDKEQKGGLRLDARDHILKGNATGPAVRPGDPEGSNLIRAIGYEGPVKMPPAGKLRPDEVAALTAWVKMGAPWPEDEVGKTSRPSSVVTEAQKQFWSFKPVRKPVATGNKNAAWVKSSIDAFILTKLESNGLKPAPPADRRSLIRRASFDLIGLPPTPEEVKAFVNDKSPDAFAKVVDRLLASPRYGERWGRHWLDVARYADSNGLDENKAFGHAWRYRDYVIAAFNKDKPYDQFIKEQLAGDLMPTNDLSLRNERLTATGFLSLGPKVLAEQDKPKLVMDIIDEQIEVTSKAVMGLTVACARCHDHKFDPIPTRDYYALAGIFKSTKTMANLGFVSEWLERPLIDPDLEAKRKAYEPKLHAAEAAVTAAKDKAAEEAISGLRARAGEYLKGGWELSRTALLSMADLPVKAGDPARILIEAENYSRGNVVKDFETYGKGIGVVHSMGGADHIEWDVMVPASGAYQIELRYAAAEARPVRLLLNGKVVRGKTAGEVTGSWQPEHQQWEPQGVFPLEAGKNIIRIERDAPIPHFDKLLVVAASPPNPSSKPSKSAEQIAEEYKLNVGLLKLCASLLKGSDKDPSALSTVELTAATDSLTGKAAEAIKNKPDGYMSAAAKEFVKKATEALKTAQEQAPKPEVVMAVDEDTPQNCRVHIRGNTLTLGEEAPRGFLAVLQRGGEPPVASKTSGRAELAEWLTSPRHPLTARVAVNRMWQSLFGEGLVRTADNFGFLGDKPSHPELLDWLAATFIEQGWSFKKMLRTVMLSNAYQMSTQTNPKAEAADPENRLLWRMNRRRLEAEPFRDAMLFVSGSLDTTMGGTLLTSKNNDYVTNDQSGNAAQYGAKRRSVYLPIIRNALYDMFQAFDVGDPSTVNAKRTTTTIAPQALFVMNSPFAIEQSEAMARQLLSQKDLPDTARITQAYERALSRPATAAEVGRWSAFLRQYEAGLAAKEPDTAKRTVKAWQAFCQILFASNEFIYRN